MTLPQFDNPSKFPALDRYFMSKQSTNIIKNHKSFREIPDFYAR